MKSFHLTTLSALPLCLVLTSLALAQPANPYQDRAVSQELGSEATSLSVADAKTRYIAAQQHLQNLVKGGNLPSARWKKEGSPDARLELIEPDEKPRDRLRKAVAVSLDARRQLQQAELTELENHIGRIKRALEICDAMRDTIIDQRTDELLDQLEDAGESQGSAAPGVGRPNTSGVKHAAPPAGSATTLKEQAGILKRQLDEAKANVESAERAYERALRLFKSGAISNEVLAEEEEKQKVAKLTHDRRVLHLDAFLEAHRSDLSEKKEPPIDDGADNEPTKTADQAAIAGAAVDDGATVDDRAMLAALESDVAEAKANRESAEREYKRFEEMRSTGAIEQAILDEKVEQCKRSQIRLERQELKRDAFLQTHRADATNNPRANGDVVASKINKQLAALDVQEAEVNLAEQEIRHDRYKRLLAANAIEPRLLDEQAEKRKHFQIQLEQAKAKLKALDRRQAGGRAVEKPAKISLDEPAID